MIDNKSMEEINDLEKKIMTIYRNVTTSLYDWIFFNQDEFGSKIYKNGEQILILKPVKNLFAEELAYQFWNTDKDFKMSWDESIEDVKLLKMIDSNTAILHVIFKSVLFVSKRDIVMYSHIKQINNDSWMVINHSLSGYDTLKDIVRINLDVVMILKEKLRDKTGTKTRDNIYCDMFYYGVVNLKGWLPDNVVKHQCGKKWPQVLENLCEKTNKSIT